MKGWPLLVLALLGCSDPWEGEGHVINRSYDDPDDIYIPPIIIPGHTSCSGGYSNVPRTCYTTPTITIPGYWRHEDATWHLQVEDAEGKRHWVYVTETVFNDCDDGTLFKTEFENCDPR